MKMKITKNFDLSEFACNDGTTCTRILLPNVIELAKILQVMGCVRETHIISIQLTGLVITTKNWRRFKVSISWKSSRYKVTASHLKRWQTLLGTFLGKMKQGGLGLYDTFVHYDVRGTKARWDF